MAYLVVTTCCGCAARASGSCIRHFPLTNVHPYAELAAEVAEAAGSRDTFWPMHDWLFEHQRNINPRHLMVGVEEIGLPADVIAARDPPRTGTSIGFGVTSSAACAVGSTGRRRSTSTVCGTTAGTRWTSCWRRSRGGGVGRGR
jgi:hypothetical protein